jgi:hypothetical protein
VEASLNRREFQWQYGISKLPVILPMISCHWFEMLKASKCVFAAAESHGSRSRVACCTGSGSSAEAATSSRSADVSSSHSDVSMRDSVDAVPGAPIVISGYWIGPGMDDGCGHIQAILQRIS